MKFYLQHDTRNIELLKIKFTKLFIFFFFDREIGIKMC